MFWCTAVGRVGGKYACMDLTEVFSLAGLTTLKIASSKMTKYEKENE
jgi:hypothetical protein